MTLKKCPECGKEVSSSAKVCPNCGKKLKKSLFTKIILWIVGIFVGLTVIGAFLGDDKHEGGTSSVATTKTSANELEIQITKALMSEDKQSALSSGENISASIIGDYLNKKFSQPKSVSGLKLAQDYDKNEVKADAEYKEKWLLVNGTVASIDKTLGESHISLQGFNPFLSTTAFFKGSRLKAEEINQKLGNLNKGQKVLLLCKGAGKAVTPTLRDCRFFSDAVEEGQKALEDQLVSSFRVVNSEDAPLIFAITQIEEKMTEQQKQDCLKSEAACLKAAKSIFTELEQVKNADSLPTRYKEIGYTLEMLKPETTQKK